MIAITGGTGFVGRAVLDAAAGQGIAVRALTRREQAPCDGMEWVPGTLSDEASLAELCRGAEVVVHIAGLTNAPDPAQFHEANVVGTQALLRACRDAGVARFVFVSSLSAREPQLSRYGASKAEAEKRVAASGLDWTIVRPPAVYGPRDRDMLELFRAAKFGMVPVPPRGRTSIIHVEDLAHCLLALLPGGEGVSHAVLEPDDGRARGYEHAELAKLIGRAMGREVFAPHLPAAVLHLAARADRAFRGDNAKLTPDRAGYMAHPDWVCDPARAVPEAVWMPRIDGPDGLVQTAQWYRREGWV